MYITKQEMRELLKYFVENTRGDKPWVDADDEWIDNYFATEMDETTKPILEIINRKKRGIDCSEAESAEIKQYLTELKTPHEQPIVADIQIWFPQEYEEYLRLTDEN